MKPVPSVGGAVELKAKTVELLVLLHGLRHENLNPLIGCLAEPPRAALVSEYCARGSLQDVLQQDDIKLDWSFRLSLLTDLVRVSAACKHTARVDRFDGKYRRISYLVFIIDVVAVLDYVRYAG